MDSNQTAGKVILDCKGLQCPEPVARVRDLIRSATPEKAVILVDNQAALENVGRFLKNNGYDVSHNRAEAGAWEIIAIQSHTVPAETLPGPGGGKTLVLLTTSTLGRGDDTLGARLMETFLGSLPELGDSLWRVVLLNGAVKLAATPGACLEHLKKLTDSGVGILVCGTCLNHYGLLEKKEVGETTNMMDIVTSLGLAEKIIRP